MSRRLLYFTIIVEILTSQSLAISSDWLQPSHFTSKDSRKPDLHEQLVFARIYCDKFPMPECNPEIVGRNVYYANLISDSIVYGSFAKANSREALVTICAAESERCSGATLFRWMRNQWQIIHRTPGITPRDCLKFRGVNGRDFLACRGNVRFLPDLGLSLNLVAVGGRRTYSKVLFPQLSLDCRKAKGSTPFFRFGEWARQDVNGDGHQDLTMELRQFDLVFADAKQCQQLEAQSSQLQREKLTWIVQDNAFIPDQQTRQKVLDVTR
ncbi:hypothetical protein [Deinococcus sp. QL22]|uniref:hypothetical protein n=1 Tax=Deinococcus sp. QL22 TaxID=2939437 RepID=UPI002016F70E|nr:hypothetical protein [Deinococcus sp. QL22]UQN07928.1 hypothetical protein M1R55_17655 [Deinococcus sp. QL22]